jgi:hypothetical protein
MGQATGSRLAPMDALNADIPEVPERIVPVLPPFWTPDGPPPVDRGKVTPTVDQVAALERTRTVDDAGNELSTFTADTRPTDVEAEALTLQAASEVLSQLPPCIPPAYYDGVRAVVALRAASLIELSYYREQQSAASAGSGGWLARYRAALDALRAVVPGATFTA